MTIPIHIASLRKQFSGKPVLQGIEFDVEPGTVLGLLGQNGSGKSTLIKCALGLMRPTVGNAKIFGESSKNLSAEVKARIGYVPQEVVSFPWMRVRQVISYTAAFYPNWNQPFVDQLCQRWKLPLEDHVGPLSVGQLQTLGIILALGHEPELLIFDEPVASLDPTARREFLKTLLEIIDQPRRTIVFSTHITSDLERVANRVAILRNGKIAFHGELDELKDRVKRLHITSRQKLPTNFSVPGTLRCEISGATATVCVADFDEQLVHQLCATWDADVAVHNLNLEEIFVEMHGELSANTFL